MMSKVCGWLAIECFFFSAYLLTAYCLLLTCAHRRLNPLRRLDKAFAPQFERQQSPKQLAMIGDTALVLVLQTGDVLRIEQAAAAQALRRQKVPGQRTQLAFQPFRKGH